MEINRSIRTKDDSVNDYIEALESFILSWEASNIKKLVMAVDHSAGIMADDVKTLCENDENSEEEDTPLKILGSKKWDQLIKLVGQVKDFKAVSDLLEEMKPKVVGELVQESTEKIKPTRRI